MPITAMHRFLLIPLIALTPPAFAEEPLYVLPLKPDPPFTVDGDLGDWEGVPNRFVLEDKAHATYGPDQWEGPADCSVRGHLAWRSGAIYLAVDVTDEEVLQPATGEDMWRYDHVELYLDFNPGHEPDRNSMGAGQWHFGLSPGSLKDGGEATRPEAFSFVPQGHSVQGIEVAARRTPRGYALEASVPLRLMGIDPNVDATTEINAMLAISDSDSASSRQDMMMTLGTDAWQYGRHMLKPVVFGDAAGQGSLPPRAVPLADPFTLTAGDQTAIAFAAPVVPRGREAYLFLRARSPYPKVAGYVTGGLKMLLNCEPVDGSRFANRPRTSKTLGGLEETLVSSSGEASVYFSPDFTAVDSDPHYGLLGGAKACEFEFRVTDLLREGDNRLTIMNRGRADEDAERSLAVADLALLLKTPPPPPPPKRPAPTGPIPTIVPAATFETTFSVSQPDDVTLVIDVAGESLTVESRFSAPDGVWHRGSSSFFTHTRRVATRGEAILVHDTLENTGDEDVPVMQRHTSALGNRLAQAWIAGLSPPSNRGLAFKPENPSVYAATDRGGLGLLALNDVFQVHVHQFADNGAIGLADTFFVLKAGSTYTAEWAVIPTEVPDYWSFVNAARRLREANFTLPYQFAFLRAGEKVITPEWSDSLLLNFLANKGVDVVCTYNNHPRYLGRDPYSTSFAQVDHTVLQRHHDWIRKVMPDVRTLVYYHCFIDNYPDNVERFREYAVRKPDGSQVDYGGKYNYDKIFLATLDGEFGRETAKNIDLILGPCGADGVYWDELAYSVTPWHYGEPWDGVSGDIDPQDFTLRRRKSSVTLLSLPFRQHHLQRILDRGPFLANGQPHTRTIGRLNTQRFVETGSIANCSRAVLYSPIALGDHLTERTEVDAYRWMLNALNYGCLYNWYSDRILPTTPTLASFMFPFTPLELHEGYLIGRDRIITRVSGVYGWGDASEHEIHVFNDQGVAVPDFDAPRVERDGNTHTELRLAEDWSAAIIRRSRD